MRFIQLRHISFSTKLYVTLLIYTFSMVIILASISFTLFLNNYNKEIETLDRTEVTARAGLIRIEVEQKAYSLFMQLSQDSLKNKDLFFFLRHSLKGNHSMVLAVRDYLLQELSSLGSVVWDISIYYSQADILISAQKGIRFDYSLQSEEPLEDSRSGKGFWYEGDENIKYIRTFPFSLSSDGESIMIITFKKDSLLSLLQTAFPERGTYHLIMKEGGTHWGNEEWGESSRDILYQEKSNPVDNQTLNWSIIDLDGGMIYSISEWSDSPWKIVKRTEIRDFYTRSINLRDRFIIICLIILILSLLVTALLTKYLYLPLKNLTRSVREMNLPSFENQKVSEYELLETALGTMVTRVNSLENRAEISSRLMASSLISSMYYHNYQGVEELRDRITLMNWEETRSYYSSIIIKTIRRQESIQLNNNFLYTLMETLTDLGDRTDRMIQGAVLSPDRIGIIMGSGLKEDAFISQLVFLLRKNAYTRLSIICGPRFCQIEETAHSFDINRQVEKYIFYLNQGVIIDSEREKKREFSEEKLDRSFLETFSLHLRMNNQTQALTDLDQIEEEYHRHFVSYGEFVSYTTDLIRVLDDLLQSTQDSYSIEGLNDYENTYPHLSDLFQDLKGRIPVMLERINEPPSQRKAERVELIRSYIDDHLDEVLDLCDLSEQFGVTEATISRDFKAVTGSNFMEYIQQKRIDKAAGMLTRTKRSIQDIARACGYNSPSYFVSQFRKYHGCTPGSYRRR